MHKYGLDGKLRGDRNYFVFVCFGDLKNYDFYYRMAYVQSTEKFATTKGKKLKKELPVDVIDGFRS